MEMTERETNDLKEWARQMVTIAIGESTRQMTECIYGKAIPGHERDCRHWFAIKISAIVLSLVISFLGIGNIWGFTALLNAINSAKASAAGSAAGAHTDSETAHQDTKK
jgi:hypothetical protein